MDKQELRISIAKKLGYEVKPFYRKKEQKMYHALYLNGHTVWSLNSREETAWNLTPNWPNDIDAAMQLEEMIPEKGRDLYVKKLMDIIRGNNPNGVVTVFDIAHATAEQRCHAWLQYVEMVERLENAAKLDNATFAGAPKSALLDHLKRKQMPGENE